MSQSAARQRNDIDLSDATLVSAWRHGDTSAFEKLVRRYQTLVCSIAYAVVGDVAASEDVGQDAFIAAWQAIERLDDPSKFKSWICSIVRKKAINSIRGQKTSSLDSVSEVSLRVEAKQEQQLMQNEESDFVWQVLSNLPVNYREPLVLYYRQGQSVGEVAESLDLSADAVKQRLARGREMLRTEVLSRIGQKISETAPRAAFTATVLAAVTSLNAKAVAAGGVAGTMVVGSKAAASQGIVPAVGGAIVGLFGPLLGFAGAWLGSYVQWSVTRYANRRRLMVRFGVYLSAVVIIFVLPYLAILFGWKPWEHWGTRAWAIVNAGWILSQVMSMLALQFWYSRVDAALRTKNEREKSTALPPNGIATWIEQFEGWRYRSRLVLFGAPLIDVQFGPPKNLWYPTQYYWANGWVAIGDVAIGRLFAAGWFAAAPIAVGNMAVGLIAVGVVSVSLLAFGVVAIGVVSSGVMP